MISLGGALGAALVAIVAPLTLPGYFELGSRLIVLSLLLVQRLRGTARGAAWPWRRSRPCSLRKARTTTWQGVRVMERDFYGVVRTATIPIRCRTLDAARRHQARRPACSAIPSATLLPTISARLRLRTRVHLTARDGAGQATLRRRARLAPASSARG